MSISALKVVSVGEDAPTMDVVLALADSGWKTLGFIPAEALRKAARQGDILAAVDPAGTVFGYVWYSVSRSIGEARIHHLCVDSQRRHAGVGRTLIDAVKAQTKHLRGVSLKCCREFRDSCDFWRRVGFVPVDEQSGRGKNARVLTCFRYDHGHPDLWSEHRSRVAASRVGVVLDANVFFDLSDENSSSYKESRALLADWIGDFVALWVTDELLNEIDRHADPTKRRRQRTFARSFNQLPADEAGKSRARALLDELLPKSNSTSDESDRQHLAAAAAGGADFFVTRDRELLALAPPIAEQLGVNVVSPLELILTIDEQQHKTHYDPRRLAGSSLTIQHVTGKDIRGLCSQFLSHDRGERRSDFEKRLRAALADVEAAEGFLIQRAGVNLALLAVRRADPLLMEIVLLRVQADALGPTIARHLVARMITRAVDENRSIVSLTDPAVAEFVLNECQQLGFVKNERGAAKANFAGIRDLADLSRPVEVLRSQRPELSPVCIAVQKTVARCGTNHGSAEDIDYLEHLLWPLKVNDNRAASYMVPIWPQWAKHLFDEHLAGQDLFAPDTFLLLQHENVYYRSAHPPVLSAPSRVLWYVTGDRNYHGAARIRACSRVEEVVVDSAAAVFKRFSRLGVYAWTDVLETAGNDPSGEVMAFRFSATYLLPSPVSKDDVEQVLHDSRERTPQFTTALKLSPVEFARLYGLGVGAPRGAQP